MKISGHICIERIYKICKMCSMYMYTYPISSLQDLSLLIGTPTVTELGIEFIVTVCWLKVTKVMWNVLGVGSFQFVKLQHHNLCGFLFWKTFT